MSRIRWFRSTWHLSMSELAQKLRRRPFNEINLDGFVVDRVRENFVEARYIEKKRVIDTATDPFGSEVVTERFVFNHYPFRASVGALGLELLDCPRNSLLIVSRLIELANFSLSISPVDVDVVVWSEKVRSLLKGQVIANLMQVGGVEVERGIIARIVIKGDADVQDALKSFVKPYLHKVERIQLKLHNGQKGSITLSAGGATKIDTAEDDHFIDIVRNSLIMSIN